MIAVGFIQSVTRALLICDDLSNWGQVRQSLIIADRHAGHGWAHRGRHGSSRFGHRPVFQAECVSH